MKNTQRNDQFIEYRDVMTKKIGRLCKYFREDVMEISQREVAEELKVNQSIISHFERGNNDSASILIYYISKGLFKYLDIKEIEIYASRFLYEHYGY